MDLLECNQESSAKAQTAQRQNKFLQILRHWMTDNAVCCIKAECPVYTWGEPDRLDTLIVYDDE